MTQRLTLNDFSYGRVPPVAAIVPPQLTGTAAFNLPKQTVASSGEPLLAYVPPPADTGYTVQVTFASPVEIDPLNFGMTALHAGQSYSTLASTPDPGGTKMSINFSRQFFGWGTFELSPGSYTWSGITGQNALGRAQWFFDRGIPWVGVVTPSSRPSFYPGYTRGPGTDPEKYKNFIKAVIAQFEPLGLVAIEMSNEPESGSWWGTLGHDPSGASEVRQAAREQAPYIRHAKQAILESGRPIELWGLGCQSMATADSATGLAYQWCDTGVTTMQSRYGDGALNGSDGAGGIGADWLDRFSWHGYPSPYFDPTLLIPHYYKAKAWLDLIGKGSMPQAVTEHGVISFSTATNRWRTMTPQQRERWVLNSYGAAAAMNMRVIYYAWDEAWMGLYGSNPPLPGMDLLNYKVKALMQKLAEPGMRIWEVRKGTTDGQLALLLGTALETAVPYALD